MTELIKKAATIVTVLILSVGFLGSGMLCLTGYDQLTMAFSSWGYPRWFIYLTGILELAVALMIFHQPWRKHGIYLGYLIMTGALATHIKSAEYEQLYGPIIVLVLLTVLLFSYPEKNIQDGH